MIDREIVSKGKRKRILEKTKGRCWYCGCKLFFQSEYNKPGFENGKEFNIEHQHSLSKGGRDSLDNIVASCRTCNFRKGARTVEEYRRSYTWTTLAMCTPLTEDQIAWVNHCLNHLLDRNTSIEEIIEPEPLLFWFESERHFADIPDVSISYVDTSGFLHYGFNNQEEQVEYFKREEIYYQDDLDKEWYYGFKTYEEEIEYFTRPLILTVDHVREEKQRNNKILAEAKALGMTWNQYVFSEEFKNRSEQ